MYRSVLALLFAAVLLLGAAPPGSRLCRRKRADRKQTWTARLLTGLTRRSPIWIPRKCHLSGGRLLLGHGTADAVHPRVIDAESGYANGTCQADADYKTVCKGETGFRETVRVEYDPEQVSLDALLMAYFYVIDPRYKIGRATTGAASTRPAFTSPMKAREKR